MFDANAYGEKVAGILALDGGGMRLMPLVAGGCGGEALRGLTAEELFPGARAPEAALSGLWLYFSRFEEAHKIAQGIGTEEGSYWHAIAHRQEPDAGNAAYWFARVGKHALYPAVAEAARAIAARRPEAGFKVGAEWEPLAFVEFCEAVKPGTAAMQAALEIQRAEWQALFDYCARRRS